MAASSPATRTELAHRSSSGIDVTLVWVRRAGVEQALVCVHDQSEGCYFEIAAKPSLALEVYYHPFIYRDLSVFDTDDILLAA
jgi:hypothetical protein